MAVVVAARAFNGFNFFGPEKGREKSVLEQTKHKTTTGRWFKGVHLITQPE